jgi:hypothetical protein
MTDERFVLSVRGAAAVGRVQLESNRHADQCSRQNSAISGRAAPARKPQTYPAGARPPFRRVPDGFVPTPRAFALCADSTVSLAPARRVGRSLTGTLPTAAAGTERSSPRRSARSSRIPECKAKGGLGRGPSLAAWLRGAGCARSSRRRPAQTRVLRAYGCARQGTTAWPERRPRASRRTASR